MLLKSKMSTDNLKLLFDEMVSHAAAVEFLKHLISTHQSVTQYVTKGKLNNAEKKTKTTIKDQLAQTMTFFFPSKLCK